MCIIMLKPAGVDMPEEKEIRHMFTKNPHGAGFALQGDIHKDGRFIVEYEKGFMTADDLIKALNAHDNLKDLTVVTHCRIATSGEKDQATTHPFLVSDQYSELKKLKGKGTVLFHNGVFQGMGGLINAKSSDTQDFVVGVANQFMKDPKMPSKLRQHIIQAVAGDCRFIILYENKKFPWLQSGKWHEHNGCLYSNMGYYTPIETSYSSTIRTGGYDYYDDNHYYSKKYKRSETDRKQHTYDEWGANIGEWCWPNHIDHWYVFDEHRWNVIKRAANSTKTIGAETRVTFNSTGIKEWILDEEHMWLYDDFISAEVDLRIDEEDFESIIGYTGIQYIRNEYLWFDDDQAFEAWLDTCEKIGQYTVRFQKQIWYLDVVQLEAFTEAGIKQYFKPGEQGHVRKELEKTGTYISHSKYVSISDGTAINEDDKKLLDEIELEQAELELERYGRS